MNPSYFKFQSVFPNLRTGKSKSKVSIGNQSLDDILSFNIYLYTILTKPNQNAMKKPFILLMALFFNQISFSQSCLPEGITFTTQSQIDNFHNDYPGCTIIEGNVNFAPNMVTSLVGLNGITAVNGDLNINITLLKYLSGLNSLTKVGGNLIFNHNDRFRSLSSLENLDSVGGVFELSYSDTLPDLNGLENLTYVGDSLRIIHCDSLANLSGLENLAHVGNLIIIYWNGGLLSLDGLNGLDSITSIYIHDNNALTDVSALGNLDTIPNYLSFGHNDILPGFYGLNSIKAINGGLRVTNNDAIVDFEGFDSLSYAGFLLIGSTDVGGNASLINLSGLENVRHLDGDLIISRNPMLVDLGALSGLDSIAGYIEIYKNTALTTLDGLDNIGPKSISDLTITDNWSLSECAVESICKYLAAPGGDVDIHNNDPGCDSREEVEAACNLLSTDDNSGQSACIFYPNPARDNSHFSFRLPDCVVQAGISQDQYVSLKIYDLQGKEIVTVLDEMKPAGEYTVWFDASILEPGIYIYHLAANGQNYTGKLIVIR
jgi:hypothetical protein